MEDQEQTKKKDLQQTQKLSARAVGKRVLVEWYETERQSTEKRSRRRERGGAKEKRSRRKTAR